MMEKYITDERTGLKYESVGDYYLIAGEDEPEEERSIGVWGQRHLRYLKEHRRVRYDPRFDRMSPPDPGDH